MSHSFAAYIAYHKYELGIPFHHLSRHIKEVLNLDMSKQNLAKHEWQNFQISSNLYMKR